MKTNSENRISLRDIGKHLGVSHMTISLALRDDPRVSHETRLKVRRAAVEMNYQPDPMLQALARYRINKSNQAIHSGLAWINGWQPGEKLREFKEFDLYWQGALKNAQKLGYGLEEFPVGGKVTPGRLHQILAARSIHGILLPPQFHQPDWENFPWEHYSVVRFGRSLKSPCTNIVSADQVYNAMLAFQKMRELGYKRIGFVTNESLSLQRGHLFEAGYYAARRLVGVSEQVPICALNEISTAECAVQVVNWVRKHRIEAIFTDVPEIRQILHQTGLRVPQDIGLAVTTVLENPSTAGINQHPEEIGREAVCMLNSQILGRLTGVPEVTRESLIHGTWVDGESLPRKGR